jgi:hypothetical protein
MIVDASDTPGYVLREGGGSTDTFFHNVQLGLVSFQRADIAVLSLFKPRFPQLEATHLSNHCLMVSSEVVRATGASSIRRRRRCNRCVSSSMSSLFRMYLYDGAVQYQGYQDSTTESNHVYKLKRAQNPPDHTLDDTTHPGDDIRDSLYRR